MQQSVQKCKQLIVHQLHSQTAQHCHIAVRLTAVVAFPQFQQVNKCGKYARQASNTHLQVCGTVDHVSAQYTL